MADWRFGDHHTELQWQNRMKARGWTPDHISEAISTGSPVPAVNLVRPGQPAERFVHPVTGRSVVIDPASREILHIGGDGFVY